MMALRRFDVRCCEPDLCGVVNAAVLERHGLCFLPKPQTYLKGIEITHIDRSGSHLLWVPQLAGPRTDPERIA